MRTDLPMHRHVNRAINRATNRHATRAGCRPAPWLLPVLLLPLWGCSTTYVPVVTPPLKCETPAALRQGCAAPTLLKEGSTYGELLGAYLQDRQALQRCALQHEALKQAVATCEAEIERHNAELVKLNDAASQKKP